MESNQAPDYMDERVFQRNRLPSRAYFLPDETLLLSGRWRFHYSTSPLEDAPDSSDTAAWTNITVPGHMELQGFGHPHYTNFIYPFPCDPPMVPSNNPTGHYETTFAVPQSWTMNGGFDFRLRFEGVDSAFHLFLNGVAIGYNQSSRNASEFDISHAIATGPDDVNTLRVKVYKWSDGSYIEDQDMWWLSGIFRDVYLLAFPKKAHVEDFFIRTSFDKHWENALLEVDITPRLDFAVELRLEVTDSKGQLAAPGRIFEMSPNNETVTYALNVIRPKKWTAETPDLYTLTIRLSAGATVFQEIRQRFGFRTVEISKGLLRVNGVPIMIKGTNRHDHHPRYGRAVPLDFIRHDLHQMKRFNLNALRTSHYPNDPRLVGIADEIGLFVLAEADLECHGIGPAWDRLPTDSQSWEAAYVDRMKQLVHRDKNHPSVIIWSLGNESFIGKNHHSMYLWSKSYDKTRPVHYEGDHEFRSSDICSYMYLSPQDLANTAEADGDHYQKPVILQEYLHAMGNGPGAAKEYMETFRKHRRLQGGFVWEWANHGLVKAQTGGSGQSFYAYGGDFGDQPNDGNFVMDGLCTSEHMPGPGLIQMKSAYQPVDINLMELKHTSNIRVVVHNLYDFQDLHAFDCHLTMTHFPPQGQDISLATWLVCVDDISPATSKVAASLEREDYVNAVTEGSEVWVNLSIRTAKHHSWADIGHEVAFKEFCIHRGSEIPFAPVDNLQRPKISADSRSLRLEVSQCQMEFDLIEGRLKQWINQGSELISDGRGPQLTVWRGPTDNDKAGQLGEWNGKRLSELIHSTRRVRHRMNTETGAYEIAVESDIAPPVLAWKFHTRTKYTIHSDGKLIIAVTATPSGDFPGTLPRIGLGMTLPSDYSHCRWFGLGPEQSYRDMKSSGKIGIWSKGVEDMCHMYEMPQESGNRTSTRWTQVTDERGNGLRALLKSGDGFGADSIPQVDDSGFSSDDEVLMTPTSDTGFSPSEAQTSGTILSTNDDIGGFDFCLSRYSATELDRAQHPHELPKSSGVHLRLDADHHGLGTASCGPDTLDQYQLKTKEFRFSISLEPVRG